MTAIKIEARWNPGIRKFEVEIELDGHRQIERISRSKWNRLIVAVKTGKKFRVAGWKLRMIGPKQQVQEVDQCLRRYLLSVDKAFAATGSTDYLAE